MLYLYFIFSVLFIFIELCYLFEFAVDTTYYRRAHFYAEGPIFYVNMAIYFGYSIFDVVTVEKCSMIKSLL